MTKAERVRMLTRVERRQGREYRRGLTSEQHRQSRRVRSFTGLLSLARHLAEDRPAKIKGKDVVFPGRPGNVWRLAIESWWSMHRLTFFHRLGLRDAETDCVVGFFGKHRACTVICLRKRWNLTSSEKVEK